MKLSTLIAKTEDLLAKGISKAAIHTQRVVADVKTEVRASRLARGELERLRIDTAIEEAKPGELAALSAAVEAAEIEERATEMVVKRMAREAAAREREKRRDIARRVLKGEINIDHLKG